MRFISAVRLVSTKNRSSTCARPAFPSLVASAGSEPTSVNPFAIRAMAEIGIDISGHQSKAIGDMALDQFATAVTLCAEEVCPVVVGLRTLHWPFSDPAAVKGSDQEVAAAFRAVRDEIRGRLEDFLGRDG